MTHSFMAAFAERAVRSLRVRVGLTLAACVSLLSAACSNGPDAAAIDGSPSSSDQFELSTAPVFRSSLPAASQYPDVLLDAVESTSGWSGTTLDTTEFKSGTASLRRSSSTSSFYRTFSTRVDVSNMRFLTFWYYIDDPSKITNTDQQVEIGSAGTYDQQERNWPVTNLYLHRGWNYVVLDIAGARHRTVNGVQADLKKINWFRIYHHPNASITTRIDQIVFTNRPQGSAAYSEYIDRKESLIRHPDGINLGESAELSSLLARPVDDVRRKRKCRELNLLKYLRSVGQFGLTGINLDFDAVTAVSTMEAYVCGNSSLSGTTAINTAAKNYVLAEVNLVQRFASVLRLSERDAADTAAKYFEFNRNRIMESCGTRSAEVETWLETGVRPANMVGTHVLFRDCAVNTPQDIYLRISGGRSLTTAGDRYRACWEAFTSQASDCSNPYASGGTIDDLKDGLDRIKEFDNHPQLKKDIVDVVRERIEFIESLSLIEANDLIQQRNEEQQSSTIPTIAPTEPTPGHPRQAELETLHNQYDDARGREQVARMNEESALRAGQVSGAEYPEFYQAAQATGEAYHQTAQEQAAEAEQTREQICAIDPSHAICKGAPPPQPGPEGGPDAGPLDPGLVWRCSEFNVEGSSAWYETPTGTGGESRQVNSFDRIEHCLCDIFDKQYPDLPQFQLVQGVNVSTFCPSPEARIMQECTQPGWDDGPPSPLCRNGLVDDEGDHSALSARLCWAMRSTLCPDPRILSNGECNCFTLQQGGQPPPRRCNLTSLCDPDSVPDDSGCGCRRFDSPRICAGNILSATKPVINFHSNVSALAGRPVLSVDTTMPIVTRSVSTNMLTNGNQLGFDVFNPNDGGAMTATADVRCTNLQAGVSNYLVDRLTLPDIGSGKVANVTANFSTADLDRCFGTSRTGSSNFEIKFSPSRSVARISYVANRTFASILDPIFPEQPCTFPTVGPTPRPTWNLSTGEVLRRDLPIVYPTMLESGLIAAPATVVDPVVFTRDYGTSPLALLDRSNTPTTSQLAVSHVGPIQGLTLQLRLRGNTRASRYGVTLVAPNGTAVYSTSSIAGDGENFDAGLVATLAAAVEGQGNWTLQVRDFGGTNGGAKSGDLYAWSLNFNPAETWEDDATESTTYPSGWSCNGRDGFEDIPGEFYGDGGCDCGCGALDIDCASNSVSACEYVFCRSGQNVNPNNNALCQ